MSNSRVFTTTQVIILMAIGLLFTGFPGKAWGEEPVSPEYVKMLAEPCSADNASIFSENIVDKNQCGCPPPGPYICIGCFEYTCIGLYSYASLISDACWLIAFCFMASDCMALCVGLIPEPPPFK